MDEQLTASSLVARAAGTVTGAVTAPTLIEIDWYSVLIAILIAGVIGIVRAAEQHDAADDAKAPLWWLEFSVAAIAGAMAYLVTELAGVDYRGQLVATAAAGWTGRYTLTKCKTIIDRLSGGQ